MAESQATAWKAMLTHSFPLLPHTGQLLSSLNTESQTGSLAKDCKLKRSNTNVCRKNIPSMTFNSLRKFVVRNEICAYLSTIFHFMSNNHFPVTTIPVWLTLQESISNTNNTVPSSWCVFASHSLVTRSSVAHELEWGRTGIHESLVLFSALPLACFATWDESCNLSGP